MTLADDQDFADSSGPSQRRATRILIIEDNPGDAFLIEQCFRQDEGCFPVELIQATTLQDALAVVEEQAPDFALLDLSLPDSHGLDTFRNLQQKAPKLPVVVLSGNENEELAAEIVKLGAQDSLSKDVLGLDLSATLLRRTVRHAIERKRAHESLKAMQMQLIQAEKLESLGRLAAGVAHEVRNPLANIQLGLESLTARLDSSDPKLSGVLERMDRAVVRAKKILDGMLTFAADRGLQREPAQIEELIENSLLLIKHELTRRKIEVDRQFAAERIGVLVDIGKIEQVLINLMLNAAHAMDGREKRKLTVSTARTTLEGLVHNPGFRSREHLRNGEQVAVITIEDTGGGVAREDLERIWDPFFTTKPAGAGTGLGLSVVRKIVELHNGMVSLANHGEGVLARMILRAE